MAKKGSWEELAGGCGCWILIALAVYSVFITTRPGRHEGPQVAGTDEQLLARVISCTKVGNFVGNMSAVDAVSELVGRGNQRVTTDVAVVDCLIATGALLLNDEGEWRRPGEAEAVYRVLTQYAEISRSAVSDRLVVAVLNATTEATQKPTPGATPVRSGRSAAAMAGNTKDGVGAQRHHALPTRLRLLFLAIKLGVPGTEERLNQLLDVHGDVAMVEDYLNCGSPELERGARSWAAAHGYTVLPGRGSHRAKWGQF